MSAPVLSTVVDFQSTNRMRIAQVDGVNFEHTDFRTIIVLINMDILNFPDVNGARSWCTY